MNFPPKTNQRIDGKNTGAEFLIERNKYLKGMSAFDDVYNKKLLPFVNGIIERRNLGLLRQIITNSEIFRRDSIEVIKFFENDIEGVNYNVIRRLIILCDRLKAENKIKEGDPLFVQENIQTFLKLWPGFRDEVKKLLNLDIVK